MKPRDAAFGGILVFWMAMLSHAVAADPFPNQPGALSAEEIQAATEAMKRGAGPGPALELAASGRRKPGHFLPGYALFATPFVDFNARAKTRNQVICNFNSRQWLCSQRHDGFRMSANGIEHHFSYLVIREPGDRQAALDAVDFMYSLCYRDQFAAIGGMPFAPSPEADLVTTVRDDSGRLFLLMTGQIGQEDVYQVAKTDKSVDGCGFRIHSVTSTRSGTVVTLPENTAKEMEKKRAAMEARREAEEKARKEAEAAQARRKSEEALATAEKAAKEAPAGQRQDTPQMAAVRSNDVKAWRALIQGGIDNEVVGFAILGSIVCALAALVVPWRIAAVLTVGATALFLIAEFYYRPGGGIRLELVIIPPLLLLAWTVFLIRTARRKR